MIIVIIILNKTKLQGDTGKISYSNRLFLGFPRIYRNFLGSEKIVQQSPALKKKLNFKKLRSDFSNKYALLLETQQAAVCKVFCMMISLKIIPYFGFYKEKSNFLHY